MDKAGNPHHVIYELDADSLIYEIGIMKVNERNKAVELRKRGKTFGEILREISVSRGSLSYWLRDITLTPEQSERIKYKNEQIKEKFIKFNELRKDKSQQDKSIIISNAIKEIDVLSARELKLMGIALYWAEGYKGPACKGVEFTNTDPAMIKLMMRWFREVCGVRESKFRIRLQVYNEKNVDKIIDFWAKNTGIPHSQFTKPYLKTSPTSKKKVGNLTPCGICSIRISDIQLITKIRGWIQGLTALSSSLV